MRKDVVAHYLAIFAMVGLYNKFTNKSTYTRICAPSNLCVNFIRCNSCHGRPHGVAPTRGCGALPQIKRKRRATERHSRIQAFSVVPYNPQQSNKPKFIGEVSGTSWRRIRRILQKTVNGLYTPTAERQAQIYHYILSPCDAAVVWWRCNKPQSPLAPQRTPKEFIRLRLWRMNGIVRGNKNTIPTAPISRKCPPGLPGSPTNPNLKYFSTIYPQTHLQIQYIMI